MPWAWLKKDERKEERKGGREEGGKKGRKKNSFENCFMHSSLFKMSAMLHHTSALSILFP